MKLWKISERNLRIDGPLNTKSLDGTLDLQPHEINNLVIPQLHKTPLMVEASPRKIYANAHTYHVNSISVNSDDETYLSADDLRINLWSLQRTDQSFSKKYFLIYFDCYYDGIIFPFLIFFCCLYLIIILNTLAKTNLDNLIKIEFLFHIIIHIAN